MEHISLIYKLLVLHLVIGEANLVVERLGLGDLRVASPAEVVDFTVSAPKAWNLELRGLDGAFRTTNFSFALVCSGENERLNFVRLHRLGDMPGGDIVEDWGDEDGRRQAPKRSVRADGALAVARDWLGRLGFDVAYLEKRYPGRASHVMLPAEGTGLVSSRFVVEWGGGGRNKAERRPIAQFELNQTRKWPVRLIVRGLWCYTNQLPKVPHMLAVSLLPDDPVLEFMRTNNVALRSPQFTNVFKLLESPPAYDAAMRAALLKESAEILSILGCDQLDEPKEENLTDFYAYPPSFGFGGRIEFRNGEMQFDQEGKLRYFSFLPRGQTNFYLWLALKSSLITSNEAHQIAMTKLSALGVDVAGLDRDCTNKFQRGRFYKLARNDGSRTWFDTPEFLFKWYAKTGDSTDPIAVVVVDGDICQVGKIEFRDTRYWSRPPVRPHRL